ncbi:tRNA (guanine(37)-N1)-methyltransferase Trm5b [uncultured archaeon]|nr:tRNA (guanine(37)-N1)-methyltransferase Trm5b [uncultured archaeon]
MSRYPFDILGNTAIVKFPEKMKSSEKIKFGKFLMKEQSSIKTVLEKAGKFSGRLRKMRTRFISGENTKEVLYRENGCVFRFNIDTTYFSPRLSNERKDIASLIKKNEEVLVMFAGVGPFSVEIGKNSKAKSVYSNELNREANKYGQLNIELNKLKNKIILIPGDIKRVVKKLNKKFDVIVMPRPQLKDSFLEQAFMLSKKGTKVYYYDFCEIEKIDKIVEMVKQQALKFKKKIKITKVRSAGDIGPYKIRLRVDFQVLN